DVPLGCFARMNHHTLGVINNPFHVRMTVAGQEDTLEFDESDMSSAKPKPLKEEYSRVFYETPDIEQAEEWKEVRDHWQSIQDVADP
ncbi:hypothetical protein KQE47_26510, partial [Raoultella planticola]|uniref:hypothetical protein n=1 Tax=Raoultella planticola TaxID=575 RepID=UPI00247FB6B6